MKITRYFRSSVSLPFLNFLRFQYVLDAGIWHLYIQTLWNEDQPCVSNLYFSVHFPLRQQACNSSWFQVDPLAWRHPPGICQNDNHNVWWKLSSQYVMEIRLGSDFLSQVSRLVGCEVQGLKTNYEVYNRNERKRVKQVKHITLKHIPIENIRQQFKQQQNWEASIFVRNPACFLYQPPLSFFDTLLLIKENLFPSLIKTRSQIQQNSLNTACSGNL